MVTFNEHVQIIFTISPVRYLAFGSEENTISKSILFNALYMLKQDFESIYYFPSYEILMDDLRDYRFYNEDLLHPNDQAISYVWEKIKTYICTEECKRIFEQVEAVKNASNHKPRNSKSQSYQSFIQKTLKQIEQLEDSYRYIDFSLEKEKLSTRLYP
ncbi:MAG: GSCFA domain-containing protein [Bacteroidetes bacterium]|nr:GSCFA domain-containing protein [Bacteroidota bacterium]